MTRTDVRGRASSVGADFLWTSGGNIVFAACQWAQVLVLARFGGAEVAGAYALAMAAASPVIMFATLSLRPVLASDVAGRHPFRDYLGMRVACMAAAFLVVVGMTMFDTGGDTSRIVLVLIGLALALEYTSDIYYAESQRRERLDRCAIGLLIKGVVSIAALAAGMLLTGRVVWACAGLMLARLATLVFYDCRLAPPLEMPRFRAETMRELFRTSAPLGVTLMLGALYFNVPRYFIAASRGKRELGVFAALASLSMAGNFFVTSLGQAGFMRMTKAWTSGDLRRFYRLVAGLFAMTAALAGGGVLVAVIGGGPLLSFLIGREYASYGTLFAWLAVAGGCGYAFSLMGQILSCLRCFAPQVPLLGTTTAIAAAACSVLVPRYGSYGAVAAIIGSVVWYLVCAAVILVRRTRAKNSELHSERAPALQGAAAEVAS